MVAYKKFQYQTNIYTRRLYTSERASERTNDVAVWTILSMCVPVSSHIFKLFEWLYFRYERHDRTTKYTRNEDTKEKNMRKTLRLLDGCWMMASYIIWIYMCAFTSFCDLLWPHNYKYVVCSISSLLPYGCVRHSNLSTSWWIQKKNVDFNWICFLFQWYSCKKNELSTHFISISSNAKTFIR